MVKHRGKSLRIEKRCQIELLEIFADQFARSWKSAFGRASPSFHKHVADLVERSTSPKTPAEAVQILKLCVTASTSLGFDSTLN